MAEYCKHCGQEIEEDLGAYWGRMCEYAKQDTPEGRRIRKRLREDIQQGLILLDLGTIDGESKSGKVVEFKRRKPLTEKEGQ